MNWDTYWTIFGVLVAGIILLNMRNAGAARHNERMARLREEQARVVASITGDMARIYGGKRKGR